MQESYPGEYKAAYDQAVCLCRLLIEKHFSKAHAEAWQPLNDLSGVISQIDNVTSKLETEELERFKRSEERYEL